MKSSDINMNEEHKNKNFRAGLLYIGTALFLSLFVFVLVFMFAVRKKETVSVPNIQGLALADAIIELQEKELTPRVQLLFTESQSDSGLVINQKPESGSKVIINHKVLLVVSKGSIFKRMPDYKGRKLSDVESELGDGLSLTQEASQLEDIIFIASPEPIGTILEQDPEAGTEVSITKRIKLWVSKGSLTSKYRTLNYIGMPFQEAIDNLSLYNFPFVFAVDNTAAQTGRIIAQEPAADTDVSLDTVYRLVVSEPVDIPLDHKFGIFEYNVSTYPSAVTITLEENNNGVEKLLFKSSSLGGLISIPYLVPYNTTLSLKINNATVKRQIVTDFES